MWRPRARLLTVGLLAVAAALTFLGLVWMQNTAAHLPRWLPGHERHSTEHRYGDGLVALVVAAAIFLVAWLTTRPTGHGGVGWNGRAH